IRNAREASLAAASLFVFNPAVWFSMSLFGANHVLSLFFVLLAIFLAESAHPVGAWLALGIASLTRPQMLVFALLFGIVLIRSFEIRQNATRLARGRIILC